MAETLLRTPLYDAHVALGARMVPFAGYDMPVQYASVIAEAKAVREGAGMFDVSHMARLILRGDRVLEYLEHVTTNDVAKLVDGTGQYSLLPNDAGGVVDDIIVYRISPTEYRVVVNASNHAKDVAWLQAHNAFGVEIKDQTDATAMIAVQGPSAVETLASLSDGAAFLRNADAFGTDYVLIGEVACFAARSGYTGEDGYELVCPAEAATHLWQVLIEAGVKPCGLASRDTLRVEAGLPLYGHELTDETSPIAAGLGWVVGKTKTFIGSGPIHEARVNGTERRLVGIKLATKRLLMPDMKVLVDGAEVGHLTSGVYSPVLDCGIGFAYVDAGVPLNTAAAVDMRGKPEPATIVSKRFLRRG